MKFGGRDNPPPIAPQPSSQPVAPVSPRPATSTTIGSQAIETVIGPNTRIKGVIQGDGGMRVEGIVEGSIDTAGNLVITESGKVQAEIKANNVSVAGAVQGNITANRIEILDTGRVWGDLMSKVCLVNEGAYLRGQVHMPQDIQPPQLEGPKGDSSKSSTPSRGGLPGPQSMVVDVEPEKPERGR